MGVQNAIHGGRLGQHLKAVPGNHQHARLVKLVEQLRDFLGGTGRHLGRHGAQVQIADDDHPPAATHFELDEIRNEKPGGRAGSVTCSSIYLGVDVGEPAVEDLESRLFRAPFAGRPAIRRHRVLRSGS